MIKRLRRIWENDKEVLVGVCVYSVVCLMRVNWLRSSMLRAYFVDVVNGGVDGVYLDTLHAFWLWQAQRKKVEGSIDEEARDAKA